MDKSDIIALLVVPVLLVGAVIAAETLSGSHRFLANALSGFDQAASSSDAATAGTSASSTPTLVDVLQQLQLQEVFLTKELAAVETKLNKQFATTTRELRRGDSGPDVTALQNVLAAQADPTASTTMSAPTGYFGRATEQAVRAFQDSQGLPVTGIVDSDTRDALFGPPPDNSSQTFDFTPIDLSSVSGLDGGQSTLDWMQGQLSQLQSDSADAQSTIADLQSQVANLSSEIADLQANASAPAPAPSTPALAITNVQASSISSSAATITWTTNNAATSKVNYSTNSSLSNPKSQSNTTQVTNHSIQLSGLTGSTAYYYQVVSTDGYGNTLTSATASFTTTH